MAGRFLEQIQAAREAAQAPEPEATAKPTEEMTDDELEGALNQARRDLLDLQHQELRERELARVAPAEQDRASAATLAGILREKQTGKRRSWR